MWDFKCGWLVILQNVVLNNKHLTTLIVIGTTDNPTILLAKNRHQEFDTNDIYIDVHQKDVKAEAASALHFSK